MTAIAHEHITTAPPGTPDVDVLRAAMLAVGRFVIDHRELLTGLRTVARESAHLRGTQPGVRPDEEAAIAELLKNRTTKTEEQGIPRPLRSRPGQGATRPPHPQPHWLRRLRVGCTIAGFRVWYEDYIHHGSEEPLGHLDEILRAVRIEPGDPLV